MSQEEMKALLAEAWKEVFKVDEVSDDSDFFEAGGDSIMAVQISAWLIQKGVKLDLADVFMTPTFGAMADKLVETEPVYVPEAMLTKEIAAKEMGFSSVEEAEAAERRNLGIMGDQQVCTPMGDQQVCNPMAGQQVCTPMAGQQVCTPMAGQQVCTPMYSQQICTPMYGQQVCTPMGGQQVCTPMVGQQVCTPMYSQQVCTPMYGQQVCTPMYSQQVCTPMYGQQVCAPMYGQQVCTPMGGQQVCAPMGGQQVCTPVCGQQVCTPVYGQQVCTPVYGQQICTPMGGQQVCTPMVGQPMMQPMTPPMTGQPMMPPMAPPMSPDMMSGMVPPQIQKYLSHQVDTPIKDPNVIKIEKAKLGKKEKEPDAALMDVMKGLLPNFNKDEDFFAQGLTSLDTVKMVTRCGEAGYSIELKDIYMHSNFAELVDCMK